MRRKFLIKYTDPVTGAKVSTVKTFYDAYDGHITAREWAEDYHFSITENEEYDITQLSAAPAGDDE